ncbi:MAG TPA: diphosphate--fructose-6-phosphate 1-phosphotransferase [Syntrophobacteraceae bacterium]|nr:diphosphate--fructose-6-phosphate 1-phosphotransferase [Syntrophobacteraceae bacterium]
MVPRENAQEALTAKVARTEGKHSPFEDAVRTLPIPVCSVFFDTQQRLAQAAFQATDIAVAGGKRQESLAAFPLTRACNQEAVLEAIPGDFATKPSGKRVAVLFSGGPAPGGHNVLVGLKAILGDGNVLLGAKRGTKGLFSGDFVEITANDAHAIFNTGGFDFLGTDRTKVKTPEQFASVKETIVKHQLDGLIIVGGDDSNTNAAFIAEYLLREKVACCVVGVPKTIDGDLAIGSLLPTSFGFDTATKVYAQLVGNLNKDSASAIKYWHFVKLMGRTASKITLEVALQTKPAAALISEEIYEKGMSLDQVVDHLVQIITERRLKGINYGVVLVPEGLVEFIPEMRQLIQELNKVLAEYDRDIRDLPTLKNKQEFIYPVLSPASAQLMASLPEDIQEMLILERGDHGNVKVSQIETEKLLIEKVRYKLSQMKRHTDRYFGSGEGKIDIPEVQIEAFKAVTFATQAHFLGYEGRCATPSTLDRAITFSLGMAAGSLVLAGKTGYMAAITDFDRGGRILALPLSGLITSELRKGKPELVIEKSLVDLASPAFRFFVEHRDRWAKEDLFSSPGPSQYWGPTCNQVPISVAFNQGYMDFANLSLGEEHDIRELLSLEEP